MAPSGNPYQNLAVNPDVHIIKFIVSYLQDIWSLNNVKLCTNEGATLDEYSFVKQTCLYYSFVHKDKHIYLVDKDGSFKIRANAIVDQQARRYFQRPNVVGVMFYRPGNGREVFPNFEQNVRRLKVDESIETIVTTDVCTHDQDTADLVIIIL